MRLRLRPADGTDAAFAWELYRQLMKPLYEGVREWRDAEQLELVKSALACGEVQIIVVEDREVGWVQQHDGDDVIELWQLHVQPDVQGRGIGSAIIESVLQRARSSGRVVTLAVMRNNRALRLYERLGFEAHGGDEHQLFMCWRPRNGGSECPPT